MATTGPIGPDSAVSNSGIGSVAWTNPGNVTANDASNASVAPGTGNQSEYLWCLFDFSSIASSDTITAIEMGIIRSASTSNRINDYIVRLIVGGALTGNNKAVGSNWGSAESTQLYGDQTSDVWGLASPTGADVNDGNFGLAFSVNGAGSAEAYVNFAYCIIVHAPGSGPISITLAIAQIGTGGPSLTVTPAAAEITLNPAAIGLTGPLLTVDPGTPTVDLNPGQIGVYGSTITVSPAAATIALNVGSIGLAGPTLSIVTVGPVTIPLSSGIIGISSPGVTAPTFFIVLPTHFRNRNLSIHAFEPLAVGHTLLTDALIDQTDSFTQTIKAVGGYWSGQLQLKADKNEINDWLSSGLMRHIEILNPYLKIMGEFFVNRIIATIGRTTITIGPALNIVNKIWLAYSEQAVSDGEPLISGQQLLTAVHDTDSQARYGILERVVNGGSLSAAAAAQHQSLLLKKLPYPDHRENEGVASEPTITLELLGYVHLLEAFLYTQTSNDGEENLSGKLQAILGSDPNSIFSTDYTKITENTTQVPQYENKHRNALEQIMELVSLGDSSLNRYLFGIYQNRQAFYGTIPTEIAYTKSIDGVRYQTPQNQQIEPWELKPGRWLEYSDLLMGEAVPSDLTQRARSPKYPFIETVTFTMPDTVSYTAGDILTASDVLAARYGLSKG